MQKKLTLSSDEILNKEFSLQYKGYVPQEVDSFLDEVASDYVAIEQYVSKCKKFIEDLQLENKSFKDKISKLEIENALLNEKLKNVPEGAEISLANIDLLKRISLLEQALYKLGKDPSTIK